MDAQAQAAAVRKPGPCIARQPILTADENVVGYELSFCPETAQRWSGGDGESATSAAIDALNVMGLGVLCDGRLAFINCGRHMLLQDYFSLLPPSELVVEIQDTVSPDEAVLQACERLKKFGYRIALDNFVPSDRRQALIPYADFIKVDIRSMTVKQSASLAALYANQQCRMLALQVNTREQFVIASKSGFTRFQGYFFRQPESLQARQIPASQATYVRLLKAISKPQVDFAEIEDLIKREPSLCFRLLRYLNSPLLGLSSPVLSVRHALSLIGEREAVRWIRMATTLVMGQERSSDLVLSALVRARFCELIAPKVEHGNSDLFLMGMFSLMEAILSVPIGIVIEDLCLDPNVKAQLRCARTGDKTPLSPIYELMVARESGDWERVANLGKTLNLSLYFIAESYNEAMRWAHQITSTVNAP